MADAAPTEATCDADNPKPAVGDAVNAGAPSDAHYTDVADSYEAAFFYSSPEYRSWILEHLMRHFRLPDEVLAARRQGPRRAI